MNETLLAVIIFLIYFSPVFYQLVLVIKESESDRKISFKNLLKFLKFSLIFLLVLAMGFGVISHTNYFNYQKPLTYDKINQITFEDFRGLEFFKKSLYGNEKFAYVVSTLESEISDNYVTIQSLFHPSRSYVYNSHSNSHELLTHEKYHIKITELYARKAKKRISELHTSSTDKIKGIIKQIEIEERNYQKKYDYDTFHSYVFSEQKKYEKVIDSLLNLLAIFEKPKIIINEKD